VALPLPAIVVVDAIAYAAATATATATAVEGRRYGEVARQDSPHPTHRFAHG
jgi:hypothetical protein